MKNSFYSKVFIIVGALSILCTAFLILESHASSTELLSFQFDSTIYDETTKAETRKGFVEFLIDVVISSFRI